MHLDMWYSEDAEDGGEGNRSFSTFLRILTNFLGEN